MTISAHRYIPAGAAAWIFLFAALAPTYAGALEPIPSNGQTEVIDQSDLCEDCNGATADSSNIFNDNIFTRAWYSFSRDFKRNNCWPRPFVWKDRQAVRMPFVMMVNKGWQLENTLGEFHFDHNTGSLNESGRLRVHWIVTQDIPERRAIFVQRSMRPEETEVRVDSVQQWVAQIVPQGEMPPVLETNLKSPGSPAEEDDRIRVEYLKSMPPPRLPAVESMDTGYSGS